ncbi:hypothetical protein MCETHM1_03339 [Flavobacteriaceae bacterium]|jgi:hypothetical protein
MRGHLFNEKKQYNPLLKANKLKIKFKFGSVLWLNTNRLKISI